MTFKRKISLLFTILISFTLWSVPKDQFHSKPFVFQNYSVEEGLVSNTVKTIYQDEIGFIWIGTDKGLSRFDGYEFKNFLPDPDNPNSLHARYIMSILEDSKGRMWIGTRASVERYHRRNEYFELMFPLAKSKYLYVDDLMEDSDGNIWAASELYGLLKYDPLRDTFLVDDINTKFPVDLKNGVNRLFEDKHENIWIGTLDQGLFRLNMDTRQIKQFVYDPDNDYSLPANNISAIEEDSSGNLWIATYGGGICEYIAQTNEFISYQSNGGKSISNNLVLGLLIDQDHDFWVISESGLDHFFPGTGEFRNYHKRDGDPNSLANNKLWSIFEDRQENIWIGHYLEGLSRLDYNIRRSFYVINENSRPYQLSNNYVNDFAEDYQGNIWIGTDGGGLNIYDTTRKELSHRSYSKDPKTNNVVMSLLQHSNGRLYIGTYLDGLFYYNYNNDQFTGYKVDETSSLYPHVNDIRDMDEDSRGFIWTGSHGSGVNVFNPRTGKYIFHIGQSLSDIDQKIKDDWINAVFVESDDIVWIGSFSGLEKFNPKTNELKWFSESEYKGLRSNVINDITKDKEGNMVISTDKGVSVFNPDKETFIALTTHDGLVHEIVKNVVVDQQNIYWITTYKGMSEYNPNTGHFTNYDKSEGLAGNQFINRSGMVTSQNEIFVGTTDGVIHFFPDQIQYKPLLPSIVLTSFKIFNHTVHAGDKFDNQKILRESIEYADTANVLHKHDMITIEFSALRYNNPQRIRYKYKLEGFDDSWIYTTANEKRAVYINLNPGVYEFKVLATNSEGEWGDQPQSLVIHVIPPFWMETWFKILIIFAIILLVFSIYLYRIKRVKLQNKKLTSEVENRTVEIRTKNEQLHRQEIGRASCRERV